MRDIADLLDQKNGDAPQQGATNGHLQPVTAPEVDLQDEPVMVPPLQQKHELLKKVAGVDNAYDRRQDTDQAGDLNRMRKMAGMVIAGDENKINPLTQVP